MAEERSPFGCTAAQMIAEAPESDAMEHLQAYRRGWRARHAKPKAPRPLPAPLAEDALPAGMCEHCGFAGLHRGPAECIDALRNRIAVLEFRLKNVR